MKRSPFWKSLFLDGIDATTMLTEETKDLELVHLTTSAPFEICSRLIDVCYGCKIGGGREENSPYDERAAIPRRPWVPLEHRAMQKLITQQVSTGPRCGMFMLPRAILDQLYDIMEPRLGSLNPYKNYHKDDFKPLCDYLSTTLVSEVPYIVHGGVWVEPRLPTVTVNRELGKFIGIHLDSWDGNSFEERDLSLTRVSVNLGPSDRSFLFVPFTLRSMARKMQDALGGTSPVRSNQLVPEIFSLISQLPIVRIRLTPGMAYFADTDNLLHDGSSEIANKRSIHFTMRGRFRRFASGQSLPKWPESDYSLPYIR